MATRRAAGAGVRGSTKKTTSTKRTTPRKSAPRTPRGPTLANLSAQLTLLTEKVDALRRIMETRATREASPVLAATIDEAAFDNALLTILAELDRRGRHAGLVPIAAVRDAFVRRGWTRHTFDERLLQAERDFVVDLKTANDPSRLAAPELAIEQQGRGHLQYVVLR
ncbi:hypothetical protein AKJ09_00247 [Labilithrix luteola]|uniref:Uncharacterized protein n=1 Tax=Labilithrix luteola TaxID=1391654 RepID=A0A0K1PJ64_9BACT|nr:hypothetical protein [Labilithrix luteola]AKU93583.1 hypothetical protein AKJ09_00247 [Labilithrix luteola]